MIFVGENRSDLQSQSQTWKKVSILKLLGLFCLALNWMSLSADALDVTLQIEPPVVRRGGQAILKCLYDLREHRLYVTKFYFNRVEFYRFIPDDNPGFKVFPFSGLHVDVSLSNATQVLLVNIGFGLTGNFSCEVSGDSPTYTTGEDTKVLLVVELPETKPEIVTEKDRYEVGDILRANCTAGPSRPPVQLKFSLNNMAIGGIATKLNRAGPGMSMSTIMMTIQLQPVHFLYNKDYFYTGQSMNYIGERRQPLPMRNGLYLRCAAHIRTFYHEYSEIEISKALKDPIPARVTSSSRSTLFEFFRNAFGLNANNKAQASTPAGFILYIFAFILVLVCNGQFATIPVNQIFAF